MMKTTKNQIFVILSCLFMTACGGGNYDENRNAPINTPKQPENNIDKDTNLPTPPKTGERQHQGIELIENNIPEEFGAGDLLYLDNILKANSGLPLTYEASSPLESDVCKITGDAKNILQTMKQGICLIRANQAGNNQFYPTFTLETINIPIKCQKGEKAIDRNSGFGLPDYTCVPNYLHILPLNYQPIAMKGKKLSLALHGNKIPQDIDLQVNMQGCQNIKIERYFHTDTRRYISCEPSVLGKHLLTVKSADNKILFSTTIHVIDKEINPVETIKQTGVNTCINHKETGIDCSDNSKLAGYYDIQQDGQMKTGKKSHYQLITTEKGDQCIKDNATGLIWEKKTNDGGLQDKDWRYLYYNTNASYNSGSSGFMGNEKFSHHCGNKLNLCNSQEYINALNKANYCGYNDWRLPFTNELLGLVDFSKASAPMIDSIFGDILYKNINNPYQAMEQTHNIYLTLVDNEGVRFQNHGLATGSNSIIEEVKKGIQTPINYYNPAYHDGHKTSIIHFYPIMAVRHQSNP